MGDNGSLRNLTGQRFGELRVLRRARSISRNAAWLCRCSCGQQVIVRMDRLTLGLKKACCINGHRSPAIHPYSGWREHPHEYQSWKSMHARCRDKGYKGFAYYGGRGIKVCEQWKKFPQFLADMGPKPTPAHTIERKDVNGNYEPGNCRWATLREQARNTRRSLYVEHEGKRRLLIELCEALQVSYSRVSGRLKIGWHLEQALRVPMPPRKPKQVEV